MIDCEALSMIEYILIDDWALQDKLFPSINDCSIKDETYSIIDWILNLKSLYENTPLEIKQISIDIPFSKCLVIWIGNHVWIPIS